MGLLEKLKYIKFIIIGDPRCTRFYFTAGRAGNPTTYTFCGLNEPANVIHLAVFTMKLAIQSVFECKFSKRTIKFIIY